MSDITRLTVLTPGQPSAGTAPPATMAPGTVLGNPSDQWGPPIDMTYEQLTGSLSLFTAIARGVVPPSGGGTINYLRADGTWAPAGLGEVTGPSVMGNLSATLGPPTPLSPTQFTSMIDLFTATARGAVPPSAGGTANFLRADGIWFTPPADSLMPPDTVWGNPTASTAPAQPMNPTALTALVSLFGPTNSGIVPASGGGTSYFLRADGQWSLPPGQMPIPPYTIWANFSPATAAPGPVTIGQLTAQMDLFTPTDRGVVPPSGGGTNNYLRADGVWTSPPTLTPIAGPAVLGNPNPGTATPSAITIHQLTQELNLFTPISKGVVPASGGGTEKFLRADGAWADPPEFPMPGGTFGWPLVGNGPGMQPTYRQLTSLGIAIGAVENFNLAPMPPGTLKGNLGPATFEPQNLSGAQVLTILPEFTDTHRGLVPPSGGGQVNFLRADGTWTTPSSGAPIPAATVLGNLGPAPQVAAPMNGTQVTGILDIFTATVKGLVPPSGGGRHDVLHADGVWRDITAFFPTFDRTRNGLVPTPGNATPDDWYLAADGTWKEPATEDVFTHVTNGLVPAPGSTIGYGPTGYFLSSDATWQVPGTIWSGPTNQGRPIGAYEDWALFDSLTGPANTVITLPAVANMTIGKPIRVTIGPNVTANASFSVVTEDGAVIFFMTRTGWVTAGSNFMCTAPLPQGLQFTCLLGPSATWYLTNQGPPAATNIAGNVFVGAATQSRPPSIQRFTSGSGTYNRPAGVAWIRVKMTGGGGGGGGGNYASAGGNSTFGDWVANGGGGGHPQFGSGGQGGPGGDGGANGTGTLVYRVRGGQGAWGFTNQVTGATGVLANRAPGAASIWGGFTTPGSGGNGGPAVDPSSQGSGGGGAGETVEVIINNPAAAISWEVGAGGAASEAGYGVGPGEDGWAGIIVVEENY
ncbi:MAG: hypothetical protein J2P16_00600 [Mycobacterium sp.]|nr:hypothetical protein [Mycobacterium sp.]